MTNPESPQVVDAGTEGISRVLVIAAHPDDAEFGVAGTVATWTDAGIDVAYLIVTDGDAGAPDPQTDRATLGALRREEQRAAAAVAGVSDVRFLGYPDGAVVASAALRRDISRVIRQFRPDRVVCQSPERIWERLGASHPDHLAAGEAAVCAVYPDARNPLAYPELIAEGLEAFTVAELWLMAHPEVNRAVDITDAFPRKIAALREHVSQVGEGEWLEERVGQWLASFAERAGLGPGRYAESFMVVAAP